MQEHTGMYLPRLEVPLDQGAISKREVAQGGPLGCRCHLRPPDDGQALCWGNKLLCPGPVPVLFLGCNTDGFDKMQATHLLLLMHHMGGMISLFMESGPRAVQLCRMKSYDP